jgi:hypothetical protein
MVQGFVKEQEGELFVFAIAAGRKLDDECYRLLSTPPFKFEQESRKLGYLRHDVLLT